MVMNQVRTAFFLLFLFICSTARPEDLRIGIQGGLGFYRMKELKGFNTSVYESLPFKADVISNYPPFFYYQAVFLLSYKKFSVGVQAGYSSTGSRISSKDYSGEYLFDASIHCWSPGLHLDISLATIGTKSRLSLYTEGGVAFSRLNMSESLTVYDQKYISSSYSFKVRNYYLEPGLKFRHTIFYNISAELTAGYFIQSGKRDLRTDKNEMILVGSHALNAEWTGFRCGLAVMFFIPD
jgi:hypothetical protein